jgi:glycosyltransferase A (GT-A) superfamily protein (DUF2064 family)/SAM-dependent methyltransferase
MTLAQLLVLAKAPVPGRVKTRLCPPYHPLEAARLAAAALADTLEAIARTPASRRVLVLDGELARLDDDGVPPTISVVPQVDGDLATRIVAAMRTTALPGTPSVLVGMDTPQLTAPLLDETAQRLNGPGVDAVLGPSVDGGWWCLGLRDPRHAELLASVPTSTARTGELTRAALAAHGLRVADTPMLRDVDTVADAAEVAATAPTTRFARTYAALSQARPHASAAQLFAEGIRTVGSGRHSRLMLRHEHGPPEPLPIEAWASSRLLGDDGLIVRCAGPTLDVGCGPGRLTAALSARGVPALGVDIVRAAVVSARRRGALALRRSLFDRLPGEGRWSNILLADGNVGIGGDPARVLARCAALLGPGRSALVEVQPDGGVERRRVRLEIGTRHSEWFDWASVGVAAIGSLAARGGLVVRDRWEEHGRCFVALGRD